VVPNGTTVLSPDVVEYVERCRSFARQTAEAIINLAKTLVEAEQRLDGEDFKVFCDEVYIPKGGPVYKKLKKIGETASRFAPYIEQLPNTWTTIYKLAAIEAEQFDDVAPGLTPFTTAREIDEMTGTKGSRSTAKVVKLHDLTISLDGLDPQMKRTVYEAICELKEKYHFSMTAAKALEGDTLCVEKQAQAA
jgi:hypothetical protein